MHSALTRALNWRNILWSGATAIVLGSVSLAPGGAPRAQAAPAAAASSRPAPFIWSAPATVDHSPPFSTRTPLLSIACPTTTFCLAGDRTGAENGTIFASAHPLGGPGAWQRTATNFGGTISGLACPIMPFCVAAVIGTNYQIFTTTHPTGRLSAWHKQPLITLRISCPSAHLCASVNGGNILTSLDPEAAHAKWKTTPYTQLGSLAAISCPATSFCVVTDSSGDVITSTNPHGGLATWKSRSVEPSPAALTQLSCPSKTFCVAIDNQGNLLYSTNPSGGAPAWHKTTAPAGIRKLTCLSTAFCYALDSAGDDLLTTSNPAGGSSAWQVTDVHGTTQLSDASCASPKMCAAVVGEDPAAGTVLTSTNPTAGPSAWNSAEIDGYNTIISLDCPASSLCLAGDDAGNIGVSTDPTGGAAAWHTVHPLGVPTYIRAISCAGVSLCVAVDNQGDVLSSADPTGGASAWHVATVDSSVDLMAVACPTTSLCVAAGSGGTVLSSTDPTGGAAAWNVATIGAPTDNMFVSCPTASFCVSTGQTSVFTSNNPGGGASAWHLTAQIPNAAGIGAIDCPATTLCVSLGEYTFPHTQGPTSVVYYSRDPTGNLNAWHVVGLGSEYFGSAGGTMSCPTTSLCLAGVTGMLFASTKPASANWLFAGLGAAVASCPTVRLCLATTGHGDIQVGTTRAPTTTSLKASVRRIAYGHERRERLTVTVRSRAGGVPTGTVVITAKTRTICKLALRSATASCALRNRQLTPGKYHLIARYQGVSPYAASVSSAETLTVSDRAGSEETLR
jgi:hypothetical protein